MPPSLNDEATGCAFDVAKFVLTILAVMLIVSFGGGVIRGVLRGLLEAFGG